MNFLQVLTTSLRLWRQHLGLLVLDCLALLLSWLIGAGLACGTLIAEGALAVAFGPSGAWVHNPVLMLAMLLAGAIGFLASTLMLCAGTGAFLRSLAQIASGQKEINFLSFVDYASTEGVSFWFISLAMLAICAVFSLPLAAAGLLLQPLFSLALPLGLAAALAVALLAALPFWLAYAAQVVHRKGALPSLMASVQASTRAPLASILLLILLLALFFVPVVFLFLYPLWFFFTFMPLAGLLMLVFYEATQGLLQGSKNKQA